MIIRSIDSNGDWIFGNGKSAYKSGQLALDQNLKTKLLEWKGDCFFSNDSGVDWKNRLAKRSQTVYLQDEIRALILKIDGITEIVNLNLNFNSINRNLILSYSVKTIYSINPVDNIVII